MTVATAIPTPSLRRRRCCRRRTSGKRLHGDRSHRTCNVMFWSSFISVMITWFSSSSSSVDCWIPKVQTARGVFPLGRSFKQSVAMDNLSLTSLPSTKSRNIEDTDMITSDAQRTGTDISLGQIINEKRLRKPPKIITCSSTKELVHAIDSIVKTDHVVAELGSQLREISNTIREKASPDSVYVDVKRDFPKKRETTHSLNMRLTTSDDSDATNDSPVEFDFREIEKLSDWRSAFFQSSSSRRYDVLVLDVNSIVGNDLEFACLDLILEFEQMANMERTDNGYKNDIEHDSPPYYGLQYVLVKSLGLNNVASQLTHAVPFLDPNKTNHRRLCRIVATVGVQEYRKTIPGVLNLLQESHLKSKPQRESEQQASGDKETQLSSLSDFFVLEVGCHFGTSTALLNDVFDDVMGVDVGSKIIKEAQQRHPEVFFRTGDAWKTAGLLRLQQEYYLEKDSRTEAILAESSSDIGSGNPEERKHKKIGFDAVYVDVGGLSGAYGLLDTISLIKSIEYALEPQCIIVKSLCLKGLAGRLKPYWKWQKKGKNSMN